MNLGHCKTNKVLKQKRHTRFTKPTLTDMLLSLRCYWYAKPKGSIATIGNEVDNNSMRPDCIHT